MIAEESHYFASVGAEISHQVMERAFDYLDAPIKRISIAEAPMPYAKNLEALALPDVDKIIEADKGSQLFVEVMDKKEAKLQYKLSHRPMGVYQVRNTVNDKVWINSSLNLPGNFNGDRVKLNGGTHHKSPKLMAAWNEFGEESFVWEILEEVFPRSEPDYDYKADLVS